MTVSTAPTTAPPNPSATSPAQVVMIYNANAGSSTHNPNPLAALLPGNDPEPDADTKEPEWIAEARAYIRAETGTDPHIVATTSEEHSAETIKDAVAQGVPLLIAAGGDGTLRLAASLLRGSETALGILPKGTVNVLARELSIPLDDDVAALQLALHGRTRHIDMGCIHVPGRDDCAYFLIMASLGVDATAVENVDKNVKGVMGAGAYVMAGLSTLSGYVPPTVTLTVRGGNCADGVAVTRASQAFLTVITNTVLYGGDFRASPNALLDDGLLDVVIFDAAKDVPLPLQRANFAKQFGLAAAALHLNDPDVHYVTASDIEITCDPPTALQVDGDPFGTQAQFRIETLPRVLAVRC